MEEQLTARQRQVFVAIVLNGVPLDALTTELGSTRGAIYKMMFDARRKLRAALAANGYLDDERYPGIAVHRRACCDEDFDGLLAAVGGSAD